MRKACGLTLAAALIFAGICGGLLNGGPSDRGGSLERQAAIRNFLTGNFKWKVSPPLFSAPQIPDDTCVSIKDPSIVNFQGRWNLFSTLRCQKSSHLIGYLSFTDWEHPGNPPTAVVKANDYLAAPEVFYFAPQQKWYLIYQTVDPASDPHFQPAYSTTADISNPNSWTKFTTLFSPSPKMKAWLDFWVICDYADAYLFFTSDDGNMWRSETNIKDFPSEWSEPKIILTGDIFEAGHTYRLKGMNKYLTIIEARAGVHRYYQAYLADRLDGNWTPLAATVDKPFAGLANIQDAGPHWTDSISHGELLRAGRDQTLEVDPANLQLLFQGVTDEDQKGKSYGDIPWRLGLLRPQE
jgi:hypothetical protein